MTEEEEEGHALDDLVERAGAGDERALAQLTPMVYDELRGLASAVLRQSSPDQTLRTTALVHESYLKLRTLHGARFESRAQFYGFAARIMRNVLVDDLRSKGAEKRGGSAQRVPLEEGLRVEEAFGVDVLALDEALTSLAATDARKARVVELRFFGGLDHGQIADVMGVAKPTVERDWRFARAWLRRKLGDLDASADSSETESD